MDGPDYSTYTLDELLEAYNHINKFQFPERTKEIEIEIGKRKEGVIVKKPEIQSTQSDDPDINSPSDSAKGVLINSNYFLKYGFYRSSLFIILGIFMFLNIAITGYSNSILPFIGIAIQLTLLLFLSFKIKYHVTLIQIWSGLLIFSGCAGLIASCATWLNRSLGGDVETTHTLTIVYISDSVFRFIVGMIYFSKLKDNIEEKTKPEN